ncbi:MAG: ribosome-associated translation inhibitor RaiA [Pseudomonadota bacterium]
MNIEVVAREVEVTPELQDRLERKLERILDRRNKEQPVRVQLEEVRGRFQAHISMHIYGKEVFGQAEEKNLIASVDEACEKVERQVSKIYDRLATKR